MDEVGRSAAYSLTGSKLDAAENRALRRASIYPRIPVGCSAVTLRTRFTIFANRGPRSRPFVNTRPSADTQCSSRMRACWPRADAQTPHRWIGKRASEGSASTSASAFELSRINSDVLSRVTDAASSQGLVDALASEYRSESAFPASEQEGGGRHARIRTQHLFAEGRTCPPE